jgi:hypothetical protein
MDKLTLEKMAVTAFANSQKAREDLFVAAENAIESKSDLEKAKYQALTGGVIDGKNAEIREAQLRKHLDADFSQTAEMERLERYARRVFDLASIEVDMVKTLLRIAELQ